ncbi:hypothetical protein F2Q70_00014492 [Brassica cretica]|uniref:AAA+ ATPase domain-containing protein n=1 Tax=Brassica cretica TaxID=69181 RepID=A0A8S9I1N4_BRACR|nr:hypothetical protein F2Q70_00014492 [Brassica cretica]
MTTHHCTTWAQLRLVLHQSTRKTATISVSLEFLICGMSSFLRCLLSMKVLQDQTMVIQINIVWEECQQTVMTIFYQVDPSHVRKQTGDFGKAFDIASSVFVSDNEADLINKVASDVTAVLGFTPSKDFDDFVGIGAHITEIKSKLILQSDKVKVIVVAGPAGIGKTTTARVLYNQLSPSFPFSTFLENIRGNYEKPCGNDYQLKLSLQKNLLSQIFNQKDIVVGHLGVAQEMLRDKKVLVVLDEVDSWWQLEEMANKRGWFGPGSMLIITTEDRNLLNKLRLGIDHTYDMKFPTRKESLQIFCQYAFGQKSPDYGFESLAREVTGLAGDLPLALRVMGSYLRGMSEEEWIDALPRLTSSLDREIESTLRFSYDALNDKDKALFLHIACFFSSSNCKVDSVKRCLKKSELDVIHGLQVLADKSLISIGYSGSIRMHSLLQQMGREIVNKKSSEEPGKRQFLWDDKEISDVLEENTGTGTVLGILLDTSWGKEMHIHKTSFDGMNNLQFLEVSSRTLCIPEGLSCVPDKLRFLHWNSCPLRFWPSKFSGKFLVELIMQDSIFENLWEGIKLRLRTDFNIDYILPICLPEKAFTSPISLRINGKCFETIPDCIVRLSGLIKLDVRGCSQLVAPPPLPGSLLSLDARGCQSLERIDSSFQNPNICLDFAYCFNLNRKSRNLIETSACKYALLPGKDVPAHFTHRATSGSLTISLTPTPLPSSFRFKALHLAVTRQYLFHGICPEAGENTFYELSFVFIVDNKAWKVKSCGVEILERPGNIDTDCAETRDLLSHAQDMGTYKKSSKMVRLKLLNITATAAQRNDDYPSLYYLGSAAAGPAPVHKQDCNH